MDKVNELFAADKPYLAVYNNDVKDGYIKLPKHAQRISVKSHGINEYQHYTRIVFMPALNNSPMLSHLLNVVGITDYMTKKATGVETAYQYVMRTALRDRNSTERVEIIVADKTTADELAKIFGGAQITDHMGRTNTYNVKITPTAGCDKLSYDRLKSIQKQLISALDFNENVSSLSQRGIIQGANADLVGLNGISLPIYSNKHSSDLTDESETQMFKYDNHKSFRDLLSEAAKYNKCNTKDDNLLFSIGSYEFPPLADVYQSLIDVNTSNRRGKSNVKCAPNLVLDFDGGDISRELLTTIFKEFGYQFYICNSFSRKKIAENSFSNNYRVFIPLSHLVVQETYTDIYMHFAKKLYHKGYNTLKQSKKGFIYSNKDGQKISGLDVSKTGIESMMYFPCINMNEPEAAFFETFFTTHPAKIFNVEQFINSKIKQDLPLIELMEAIQEQPKEEIKDKKVILSLEQIWDVLGWEDGQKYVSSFSFGVRCKRNGYSEEETLNYLRTHLNSNDITSKINNCKNGYRAQ